MALLKIDMLISEVHYVSPHFRKDQLPFPLPLDVKIAIFEDRVLGWQLKVAEELFFGAKAADGSLIPHHIQHNGFAVLYILLSYFEMIPKYREGDLSEESGLWFKKGISQVFPEIVSHAAETAILASMWTGARNGLYHSAMTKRQVFVSGEANCIDYDATKRRLILNPGVVAQRAIAHFASYIAQLRDPSQSVLRGNFQKKFDREILPQLT